MFTFGSLFAGIGGLDLGLERAGMTCKFQVEIDPYCRAVLAKHWPDVPRWDDATTFPPDADGWRLQVGSKRDGQAPQNSTVRYPQGVHVDGLGVDLICGGFPCQPVSHAGRRRGTADARWLWPEFARILGVLRPRYVIVENVPGILTVNRGGAFGEVLGDLATLGYDAEWTSVPAAAVGAPHLRYRVFIVAYATGTRLLGSSGYEGQRAGWVPLLFGGDCPRTNGQWATEPDICRVAHGIPAWVDRLRVLGNAVVPQVAEWVGRQILKAEEA